MRSMAEITDAHKHWSQTLLEPKWLEPKWAITFEHIAFNLDLQLVTSSSLWKLTSHTARATGAMHMALGQIKLWEI